MEDAVKIILSSLPTLLCVAGIVFIAIGITQKGSFLFLKWDVDFNGQLGKQAAAIFVGFGLIALGLHTYQNEITKSRDANSNSTAVSSPREADSSGGFDKSSDVKRYRVVKVTDKSLNIRRTPAPIKGNIIGEIPDNGENIKLIPGLCEKYPTQETRPKCSAWVKIDYQGTEGWVNREFLTEQ